jgi:hypothetical protein
MLYSMKIQIRIHKQDNMRWLSLFIRFDYNAGNGKACMTKRRREKKRTPSELRKMSCYVGIYYTKFLPFSREKKVARVDFLEATYVPVRKSAPFTSNIGFNLGDSRCVPNHI